jgi:hypothetical protein
MPTFNRQLCLNRFIFGSLLLVATLCRAQSGPAPKSAPARGSSAYNNIRKVCRDVSSTRNEITTWWNANKDHKPDLPAPPATIPDCSECGAEGHHTPNQDKIDAYVQQLGQPELGYIKRLGALITEIRQTFGIPANLRSIPDDLSICAMEIDPDGILTMIQKLTKRIFDDKVLPSYDKFHAKKDYTLALVSMLCYYSQAYEQIVGYSHGNISSAAGTQSLDDDNYRKLQQADLDANQLIGDYYTYYLDQLYQGYHYNLYPNLIWEGRQYLMSGFNDYTLENKVYDFINRGISFMHFKLKIEFEETSTAYHYTMKGEASVRCRLSMDTTQMCYLFEGTSSKGLTLKLEDIAITLPNVSADYTGPRQSDNPFIIRINLCEGSPVLHLIFTSFGIAGPMTMHTPGGDVVAPAPMRPLGYFMPDLATAEKKKDEQQALADDFQANKDKYKAAMMEWASHRGDHNFPSTPQGKKDWALILQFQHQTGVQTPFLNGVTGTPPPAPANTGNNKLLTFDMPLHFSNQAIDYSHSVQFGDLHYRVKVTMEEKKDDSDNLSPPKPPR